jgi:hypothetical protein
MRGRFLRSGVVCEAHVVDLIQIAQGPGGVIDTVVAVVAGSGQTRYDSTVLIAAISAIGSVVTTVLTLIIRGQSQTNHDKLQEISVKVDGRLDQALNEITSLRADVTQSREATVRAQGVVDGLRSPLVVTDTGGAKAPPEPTP